MSAATSLYTTGQQLAATIGISAGAVALAETGGFATYGTQLTSRAAFPAEHPCWCGTLKPDYAAIRQTLEQAASMAVEPRTAPPLMPGPAPSNRRPY